MSVLNYKFKAMPAEAQLTNSKPYGHVVDVRSNDRILPCGRSLAPRNLSVK
jgi:hypothetical protein